ncbi:MAG: flagellar biosynthetic protein FliR [Oligoflexia bacterium]|nr:flagellar biosynthetic protein FliR [Oligoflexia bacterium]
MFEVYKFNEAELVLFSLMLIRISACLVAMPLFSSTTIPGPIKVLLSLVITFVVFLSQKQNLATNSGFVLENLIVLSAREAFIGAFIGFLARGIFWAVQVAGQVLGFTMGFSAAQSFNPALGGSGTMLEEFQNILAILLFLVINGHHWLLEGLVKSFELAPMGLIGLNPQALLSTGAYVQNVFEIAVKLSGPIVAVVLFLNVALGVVGRAVPQINVFIISFPVNILVGMFVFMVSIPLILTVMQNDFAHLTEQVFKFIKGF